MIAQPQRHKISLSVKGNCFQQQNSFNKVEKTKTRLPSCLAAREGPAKESVSIRLSFLLKISLASRCVCKKQRTQEERDHPRERAATHRVPHESRQARRAQRASLSLKETVGSVASAPDTSGGSVPPSRNCPLLVRNGARQWLSLAVPLRARTVNRDKSEGNFSV